MLNYGGSVDRSSNSSSSSIYGFPGRHNAGNASEQRLTCSQQSVLSAIERFMRAVDNMDSTVLIPSKLHDMEVQNRRRSSLPPAGMQQHQDLYSFYSVLKDVKNELIWGPSSTNPSLFPGSNSVSGMSSPRRLPMTTQLRQLSFRQPSDDGLGSSTGCPSDQDTDSDFESIVTDRDSMVMEQTSHLANAFRHHLHGLHAILHQLADSADFVAARYQEEVDIPIM